MENSIKAIVISTEDSIRFSDATKNWRHFIEWLRDNNDEVDVLKCLVYEIGNECRPSILDRLRTRYNALRTKRELTELESMTGKVISLIYRK